MKGLTRCPAGTAKMATKTSIMILVVMWVDVAAPTPSDPCRGLCQQDHYCVEWIASCDPCSSACSSAKSCSIPKCAAYYNNLESSTVESQVTTHNSGAQPTVQAPSTTAEPSMPIAHQGQTQHPILKSTEGSVNSQQAPPKLADVKSPEGASKGRGHAITNEFDNRPLDTGKNEANAGANVAPKWAWIGATSGMMAVMGVGVLVYKREYRRTRQDRGRPLHTFHGNDGEGVGDTLIRQEQGPQGGPVCLHDTQVFLRDENNPDHQIAETIV